MPVVTSTAGWSDADFNARLQRGSHTSTHDDIDFVRDEMMANFVISRVSNISAAFACPPLAVSPNATAAPV
jgi:hypothetical protein